MRRARERGRKSEWEEEKERKDRVVIERRRGERKEQDKVEEQTETKITWEIDKETAELGRASVKESIKKIEMI